MKTRELKQYLNELHDDDNVFICIWTESGPKYYDIPHIPGGKKVYQPANNETGSFAMIAWIDDCPANRIVMTSDGRTAFFGETIPKL